jgi:hypothetical protein
VKGTIIVDPLTMPIDNGYVKSEAEVWFMTGQIGTKIFISIPWFSNCTLTTT